MHTTSTHKTVEIRHGRVFTEAIEINAVWHCNIRCQWCSHASPGLAEQYADPASVITNLDTLSRFMRVDHVRILGGEPLLHPQLCKLIAGIHDTTISDKVRVLTNGLKLHQAPREFWGLVNEIHISVYPSTAKLIERHVSELRTTAEAQKVTLVLKYFDHFRVSFRAHDADRDLTERIYGTCQIANLWRCLTLEGKFLYRCPQAAYTHVFEHVSDGKNVDYLEVDSITSTRDIERWLLQDYALVSCRGCTGSVGKLMPHQQMRFHEGSITNSPRDVIDFGYLSALEADINADNSCVAREVVLCGM